MVERRERPRQGRLHPRHPEGATDMTDTQADPGDTQGRYALVSIAATGNVCPSSSDADAAVDGWAEPVSLQPHSGVTGNHLCLGLRRKVSACQAEPERGAGGCRLPPPAEGCPDHGRDQGRADDQAGVGD